MISWQSNKKILNQFSSLSAEDEVLLKKAWLRARGLHAGQKRKSGQPYFTHPVSVAIFLAKRFGDSVLTAAALLHDTVEDCSDYQMKDVYKEFGPEVGFLVDAVTKNIHKFYGQQREFSGNIERLLWAGSQDIRSLLLKIGDRQHNLNTIDHLPKNKQLRMAFETQAILLPMKEILGYDDPTVTISQAAAKWQKFLKDKDLRDITDIKNYLYKRQFVDLDGEMYDLVYGHSETIIWQMSDRALFEKLLEDEQFNKTADVLSITSDGLNFNAEFQFRQGYTNRSLGIKFGISKFSV